jgi:hypothetical protein
MTATTIGEMLYGPDTVDQSDNQPSPERIEYMRHHRDGYNDCRLGNSPKYYSGRTAAGDAYLQGWQDAHSEKVRQWSASIAKATAVVCLLLLATTASAQPLTALLDGWGTTADVEPPFYNLLRISDATTLQPLVEWSIPDVQLNDDRQVWSLNESTAASYGIDWNVVENAILNPDGFLFMGDSYEPTNYPGQTWEQNFDPYTTAFSEVDELQFVVEHYRRFVFNDGISVAWLVLGEGTVTPAPGDWNGDGTVNAADYPAWRDRLGSYDPETDWFVEKAQWQRWRENFGLVAATPASAAAMVPEPGAWVMIGILAILWGVKRKG